MTATLRKVPSAVAAAALLALATWFAYLKPHLDAHQQDPIPNHGTVGHVVSNRVFSVVVDRVDVARSLASDSRSGGGTTATPTPGIFLVVYLRARSRREPLRLGHVRLTTRDGLHYAESGRVSVFTRNSDTVEPMLWTKATYLFELPKDRLAGLHLIVGQSDLVDQLSAEADIDLRISGDAARRLLAHPADAYQIRDT